MKIFHKVMTSQTLPLCRAYQAVGTFFYDRAELYMFPATVSGILVTSSYMKLNLIEISHSEDV